jgi:hypothetical protein
MSGAAAIQHETGVEFASRYRHFVVQFTILL